MTLAFNLLFVPCYLHTQSTLSTVSNSQPETWSGGWKSISDSPRVRAEEVYRRRSHPHHPNMAHNLTLVAQTNETLYQLYKILLSLTQLYYLFDQTNK